MKKYPLKISYAAKTALWAGKRLKTEFGKCSEHERISETWELSVRQDDEAVVLDGDAAGLKLSEYFDICGYDCVTPKYKKGDRFPLLIKLIDADDTLSVQVHPDDDYASRVENDSGKTEAWHIISAREGAQIIYGLRKGATREELERAINDGDVESVMKYQSVRAGQTYFIPAGMVHAIGEGILIAEVQQNSDLTYRLYDYNRVGADGKPRELHIKKSLDVARTFDDEQIGALRFSRGTTFESGELLVNSEYFQAVKYTVKGSLALNVDSESFTSLLCIDGEGEIEQGGEKYAVKKGDSYFCPAGLGTLDIFGNMTLIASRV